MSKQKGDESAFGVAAGSQSFTPMKCHKCQGEMQMTPLCLNCGTIPIAEDSFRELREENAKLRDMLETLRPRTLTLYRNPVRGNKMVPTELTRKIDALLANASGQERRAPESADKGGTLSRRSL